MRARVSHPLFPAVFLALGISGCSLAAQATTACRPVDAVSTDMLADITRIATRTDVINAQLRQNMAIPQVAASRISYVTDNTVCNKALPVYNANARTFDANTGTDISSLSGSLYIIKVGTVYVVWDPAAMAGEFRRVVTLDKSYKVLAKTMY
jgi:hypothetical protein